MYLTTIRVRRAKTQALDGIVPANTIKRLPRDGTRLAALQVCAGGKTIAVVALDAAAQQHTVAWKEPSVQLPDVDLLAFTRASVTVMDQSAAFLGQSIEQVTAAA